MRTHARRPHVPWLALALLLSTTVAHATEPVSTEPVSVTTESIDGAASPHVSAARPRIGKIFFSPAERRSRHRDALAATPAVPAGSGAAPRERRIVNGALSSGTQGRAVWVN